MIRTKIIVFKKNRFFMIPPYLCFNYREFELKCQVIFQTTERTEEKQNSQSTQRIFVVFGLPSPILGQLFSPFHNSRSGPVGISLLVCFLPSAVSRQLFR